MPKNLQRFFILIFFCLTGCAADPLQISSPSTKAEPSDVFLAANSLHFVCDNCLPAVGILSIDASFQTPQAGEKVCAATLIQPGLAVTAANCLGPLLGKKCPGKVFLTLPETKEHPHEVLDCKTIRVSQNSFEEPAIATIHFQQDSQREILPISNGIKEEPTWAHSFQQEERESIERSWLSHRQDCDQLQHPLIAPGSVNWAAPYLAAVGCGTAPLLLGSPLLNVAGELTGLVQQTFTRKDQEFPAYRISNLPCHSEKDLGDRELSDNTTTCNSLLEEARINRSRQRAAWQMEIKSKMAKRLVGKKVTRNGVKYTYIPRQQAMESQLLLTNPSQTWDVEPFCAEQTVAKKLFTLPSSVSLDIHLNLREGWDIGEMEVRRVEELGTEHYFAIQKDSATSVARRSSWGVPGKTWDLPRCE